MKKTKNYAMPYPEQDDYFNVEDFQDMMVSVDDLMKKLSDSGAQISSDAEHLYNQTKAQMDNIQKRMNAFTALKEGSTTGDAELKDIRVAYDGKEYGNAGEAVREQASDIHKALFGAGASIWSKAKSESTKYVAETKGICILNERFTAAGVVTKISRGTFAENESTLNLDRECSAYIVEFEKNPGTVYMPSAETIKIVSTTKIIFEANGNARCWIPVEKGQYLAVDSTATAYECEDKQVPYMLYDQAAETLDFRGFGATGSTKPVDPYSLALEYKLEYDMDDTGLAKQIDENKKETTLLKKEVSSQKFKQVMPAKIVTGNKILLNDVVVGSVMKISATSDYYIGGKNITLMKDGVYNDAVTINGNCIDLNSDNIDVYPALINTLKLTSKSVVYLSVKKVSGACRIQLSLSKNAYGGKIGNGIDISSNTYKEYVGTKGFSNDATACFVYSNQNKKASILYQIELNSPSEIDGEVSEVAEYKTADIIEYLPTNSNVCIQSVDGSDITVKYIPFYKEKNPKSKKRKINKKYIYKKEINSALEFQNGSNGYLGFEGDKLFIPALSNKRDHFNEKTTYVDDTFYTYSVEYKQGDIYPANQYVEKKYPRGTGSFVEFYYYGKELSILCPKNGGYFFLVNDIVYSDYMVLPGSYSTVFSTITLNFDEMEKRKITVYCSKWCGVYINRATDYLEKCTESLSKPVICFDGDSITEASAKIGNKEVLYGYPAIVSQLLGGKMYNCGVGGSGYVKTGNLNQDNMVNRYDSYIGVVDPDYLITAGGLNDGMVDGIEEAIDTYWSNVKKTLTSGRAIVCSAYNPASSVPENLEKQGEILRKMALKYEFPYIDMLHGKVYDAFGNLLSANINGGVVTEDNRRFLYDDYYAGTSSDNTHPSAQGNIYLGKWMAQAIMIIAENDKGFLVVGTELTN